VPLSLLPLEAAKEMAQAAEEKKAADILLLDVHEHLSFADYFVLCTGNNPPHINALAKAIDERARATTMPVLHREGDAEYGWILLDCGNVVIHIFSEKARAFYQMDNLWEDAGKVLYIQ
jgi:ribosome-associated protein